jgi:hypothetical protein
MITEDYVSFEIAKLLKEKGFDEYCGYYSSDGEYWGYCTYNHRGKDYISAPTLQMAMKWLRKVHHYYIQVMLDSWAYGSHSGYYVVIQKTDSEFEIMLADKVDKVFYDEPEEACEAAIRYCLEKLI